MENVRVGGYLGGETNDVEIKMKNTPSRDAGAGACLGCTRETHRHWDSIHGSEDKGDDNWERQGQW